MGTTQVIGIVAGACTAISLLPQLLKILKEKKAQDISIPYLIILLAGLGLWIWYGARQKDLPVLLTNCVSIALNIATIIAGLSYKRKKRS